MHINMLVDILLIKGLAVLALTNEYLQFHAAFQLHQKLLLGIFIDRLWFLVGAGYPKGGLNFGMRGVLVCQDGESLVLVVIGDDPQVNSSHTILISKISTNYQG